MARAIAIARTAAPASVTPLLRATIVAASALALILAGQPLPF